jgi:uncharacterized protein
MHFASGQWNYMANSKMIHIEIAYGGLNHQKIYALDVEEGITIQEALHLSTLSHDFPEVDLAQCKVGVFAKRKTLTDVVQEGDRIEVYRPLLIDPKEARRKKAEQNAKKKHG